MISRKHRFHGYGSLRYVYQKGRTVRSPLLSLKYAPNSHRDSYRLAVVVSKKVSKSALTRNRIRRRLYEVVRLKAPGFTEAYDMVITVFSEQLKDVSADELTDLVTEQLARAGIISNK